MPDSDEQADRNRRIVRGGVASAANIAVFTLYQLVSLPIFLHYYGSDLYGDWLILYGIPALLSISDLGIPNVVGSQMTMWRSADEVERARDLYQTMRRLARYWLGGLAALLVLLTWYFDPKHVLHLREMTSFSARAALTALIFWLCISLYWGIYGAGYQASQQYPRMLRITALTRALEYSGIIAGIVCGLQIPWVAVLLLGLRLLVWPAVARDFRIHTVWTKAVPGKSEASGSRSLRPLMGPAVFSLAFPLGNSIQNQGMLLVVSWRGGAKDIVIINAIRTVTNSLYQFNGFIEAGAIPELSERFGRSDIPGARQIAVPVTSIVTFANLLMACAIAGLGPWFLRIWSGGRIEVSVASMALFAACSATDCYWHSVTTVAQAKNVHQRIAAAYFVACGIALPISYLLLPHLGIIAVGWSLFSTSIIVNIVAVPYVCRLLDTTVSEYSWQCVRVLRSLLSSARFRLVSTSSRRSGG